MSLAGLGGEGIAIDDPWGSGPLVMNGPLSAPAAARDDQRASWIIEEERRLLYVAMTRAKDHLHLTQKRAEAAPGDRGRPPLSPQGDRVDSCTCAWQLG